MIVVSQECKVCQLTYLDQTGESLQVDLEGAYSLHLA